MKKIRKITAGRRMLNKQNKTKKFNKLRGGKLKNKNSLNKKNTKKQHIHLGGNPPGCQHSTVSVIPFTNASIAASHVMANVYTSPHGESQLHNINNTSVPIANTVANRPDTTSQDAMPLINSQSVIPTINSQERRSSENTDQTAIIRNY